MPANLGGLSGADEAAHPFRTEISCSDKEEKCFTSRL
jgi:hypothetical protein